MYLHIRNGLVGLSFGVPCEFYQENIQYPIYFTLMFVYFNVFISFIPFISLSSLHTVHLNVLTAFITEPAGRGGQWLSPSATTGLTVTQRELH
jgi:hypothetical protein